METQKLIAFADLKARGSCKFSYRLEGISREGFVIYFDGQIIAYENVCRHIPIPLDYGDAEFFNQARTHLLCQNHGAVYEPLSGLCVRGPCAGASLKKLPVVIESGMVVLQVAE